MTTNRAFGLAAVLAAAMLAGCQAGPVQQGDAPALVTDDSAGYLDGLAARPEVTQDEAFAGLVLLLDGAAAEEPFEARVETLRQRGIVDRTWTFDPARTVTFGQAAYMLYQVFHERGLVGGATLMLLGPTQRYALREMQFQRLMGEGFVYQRITGMEYVAMLTRADAYIRTGRVPETLK